MNDNGKGVKKKVISLGNPKRRDRRKVKREHREIIIIHSARKEEEPHISTTKRRRPERQAGQKGRKDVKGEDAKSKDTGEKGNGNLGNSDFSVGRGAKKEEHVSRAIATKIRRRCDNRKDVRNTATSYVPRRGKGSMGSDVVGVKVRKSIRWQAHTAIWKTGTSPQLQQKIIKTTYEWENG